MSEILVNVISAISIGIIIAIMASVKDARLKALVYTFPIPLTIVLIATGGHVSGTHVLGLMFGIGFLWLVTLLKHMGLNIYLSDIVAATAYIVVGYTVTKFIDVPFFVAVCLFTVLWLIFLRLYRDKDPSSPSGEPPKIGPLVKLPLVSCLAFGLLGFKSLLAGIIVTFPFGGIFAVIEGQHALRTIASTLTRNSIAIVALFITVHLLDDLPVLWRIAAGWAAFLIVLKIVSLFVRLRKSTTT